MKKFLLVLTALAAAIAALSVSCTQPDSHSSKKEPEKPVNPAPKTLVVFDNTYGVCSAVVYDDYRRRAGDKIAEVPAGQRSQGIERSPSASEPFYFAYIISLNGVNDFTLSYVPKNGNDQKAVRIDAGATTTVYIPKLDETFSSVGQLLSPRSSLLLQNMSTYSFELHRGASSIQPDNRPGSPLVNYMERAFYTIDPGAVVNYRLLVGFNYENFPATPSRFEAGHFYSYIYNGAISLDMEVPITYENITIKTYTVSFNTNGAGGVAPAAQPVQAGSTITLPGGSGLSNSGYTFGGWNVSVSGDEINYGAGTSYLATGDITLYARWHPLGTVTHTVVFEGNGGSVTANQVMVSGAAVFRPANPVRNGYIFEGWYSDPGLNTAYDFARPVSGNITLYAKWGVTRYTVTFNTNGAGGAAPAAQTVDEGSMITLPGGGGLSKAGHTFAGWSVDDSGAEGVYDAGTSYTVNGDITLFARWDALPYAVIFNSNGGSAVPVQIVYYGDTVSRPADPVKEGYAFAGWYSNPGVTAVYDFSRPVTGNITLYAKFTEGTETEIIINLYEMDEWDLVTQRASVDANADQVFSVSGSYAAYQWYLDGTQAGTGSSYTFNQGKGVYELVIEVSNSAGAKRSGRCRVTVNETAALGIVIYLSGIDEWNLVEQTAQADAGIDKEFTVTGSYASYRWYLDGVLSGTGPAYTFNETAGVYELVVLVADSAGEKRSGRCRVTAIFSAAGGIEMVWIPGGTFTMGSPASEPNRDSDETQHTVTLSGFYMGVYQITQEEYQAVTGSNPSSFKTAVAEESGTPGKLPVEMVSWYDVLVFCNKLSAAQGLTPAYSINGSTDPAVWGAIPVGSNATWNAAAIVSGSNGYRLPTEAQWEYACRAGTTTAYNTGATISDNTGWYSDNSGNKTHRVGLKPPNAWGLYDMHGNVREWCWDWYGTSYYTYSAQTDPAGPASGLDRVLRGGSWSNSAGGARSAFRNLNNPSVRNNYIGFRLVRT